jgi:hypothetical protein
MRRNLLSMLGALAIATASIGCTSPQLASPEWSEMRPTAKPVVEVGASRGTLRVTTFRDARLDEMEPDHRGFAVFDASGMLAFTSTGYAGAFERVSLVPGRYLVVSLVGDGLFDRHNETRQALVVASSQTQVDFRAEPVVSAPEGQP